MKNLNRGRSLGLGLALIAAGLAAPTIGSPATAAPKPDPSVVDQMRSTADGSLKVRTHPATGEIGFVRATGADADLLPGKAADSRTAAAAKAQAYLDRFAGGFGVTTDQLVASDDVASDGTGSTFTYTQQFKDVPVFGAELHLHIDREGDLTSVNGFTAPDLSLGTTPRVSQSDADARALAMVKARPEGSRQALPAEAAEGLEVRSSELMIYRLGSTRGIQGESKLAWVVEVWNETTVRETVVIDALTGKHLNRWSMMAHALERELYEEDYTEANQVWKEGEEFPDGLDEDQQNEILGAGEAYWMFMNTFGYDSWDGEGGKMITVNNDPDIDCPNANWNGITTNYCTGVTGDDTVAHEWGHAYTESTSGLIYQWQSGAMNEAYSDIWGETVDMLNTRQNEGGEAPGDPVREEGDCSVHTPEPISISIVAPEEIAGECDAVRAAGSPDFPTQAEDVTVVVGVDESTGEDDLTTDGCSPLTNAAEVEGNWVYLDENLAAPCGQTTYKGLYEHMADNAMDAGAVGLIVGATPGDNPWDMPGAEFSIPAAQIDAESGEAIKSVAPAPSTLSISQANNEADTYRWLSGESDPAFGGAIRDMWNPNCYGDPGQVSDEEYHCAESDSGGVHTNSGVVNRTFAILVDGLPSAGVTPIGLDKAANLFWHTQYNYLTPTSGFVELAESLETSCDALTGVPINKITLGTPTEADGSDGAATPEKIPGGLTAADCRSLDAAMTETELRKEPVQCNFQPMLEKGRVTCGEGFKMNTTYVENFEDGLKGWEQDHEFGTYPDGGTGGVHHPWVTTTDMPLTTPLPNGAGTRDPSEMAFAVDPTTGSCAGDALDESARNGLISPEITVPDGFQPRMSFAHLMASESGWDGGNVKVSVNGEDFIQVPRDAWVLNGPGGTLETVEEGNSNPMAGQDAFTGTDGGEVTGSWGRSVVGLNRLGADPGDTVQFRFDFGRDGCNGVEGWYVDNVKVTVCEEVQAPAATTTKVTAVKPRTVTKGKAVKVTVKVSSDESSPNGKVLVKLGGKTVATGMLKNGVAVIKVSTKMKVFKPGKHKLVASYAGNASFKASKDTFMVRVKRR